MIKSVQFTILDKLAASFLLVLKNIQNNSDVVSFVFKLNFYPKNRGENSVVHLIVTKTTLTEIVMSNKGMSRIYITP